MEKALNALSLNPPEEVKFSYINVFKNPNKLPINRIHIERTSKSITNPNIDLDIKDLFHGDIDKKYMAKQTEIIPALDKRWLPKNIYYHYEPYSLTDSENSRFLELNRLHLKTLDYFLNCSYHQFWCTILFEPNAVTALRSFLLSPLLWYQTRYLKNEHAVMYESIYNKFLLVYQKLVTFKASQEEYMSEDYGLTCLINKKLINLPIVITLSLIYKDNKTDFLQKLTNIYFSNASQIDFIIKEVEEIIQETLIGLEMVGGHVCGFDKEAVIIPISIEPRPKSFSLLWIYSVVDYLLNIILSLNALFEIYKPSVEMALSKDLPYRIPFIYVNVFSEIYRYLDREETRDNLDLAGKVFDGINLGRGEFLDAFHSFVSLCLEKTLEYMNDPKGQEHFGEIYLKLLTTALEDEYFICDYDIGYSIETLNEMFQSCCNLDPTRTDFISNTVKKFGRHKSLSTLKGYSRNAIEDIFRNFKQEEEVQVEPEPIPEPKVEPGENDLEVMIKSIIDMFPHLGDGFVLQCLKAYNYNSADVINAVLEENLPPHLYEIPFDSIRIPPEPLPAQPVLAYQGKKPDHQDALALLNDKSDMDEIKKFVLEGIEYTNDYIYDDEYDDRYDNDVPIKVADNPIEEELVLNPNRKYHEEESSEEEEGVEEKNEGQNSKLNFCEDPALIRERREANRNRRGVNRGAKRVENGTRDVVGKAKGQGQEKEVLINRQKKNVQKSSRANHNRKSGAQWKQSRGMF